MRLGAQVAILDFCREEGIALLADELYQSNIYSPEKTFTSFKKVPQPAPHTQTQPCHVKECG